MNLSAFGTWLATPFRAVRSLFPFTKDGRQTLIYMMFSLSTGILTLITWWAMHVLFNAKQWQAAEQLSDKVAWGLLMSVAGYGCFISVRSFKIGRDGFDVEGDRPDDGSQN